MTLSREDRITGCLLGGALGDAVGSRFEGQPAQVAGEYQVDLRVTDDTQLTIATCEAIIDSFAVTPQSIATHFVRWFRERRITGIGSSTLKALIELDAGGHWSTVGATGDRAAGNGAAMRIAPLAFFLDPDIDSERRTIRDICRITHRHDEAYIGALAILRTIRQAVYGEALDADVLTYLIESLPDSVVRDRLTIVRDSSLTIESYARRFEATGYVADSVPLSILAAIQASDITDSIRQLVACGGDTDTIASMFGQIYGAAYGTGALPMDTIDAIDAAPLIRETAAKLSRPWNTSSF